MATAKRGKNTPDPNAPKDGTKTEYELRSGKKIQAVYDGGRMCCQECERVFQVAKPKPLTKEQKKRLRERESKAVSNGMEAIQSAIRRMQQTDERQGHEVRSQAECLEIILAKGDIKMEATG